MCRLRLKIFQNLFKNLSKYSFTFLSLADLAELADFIFHIFLPHLNLIAKAIGSRGGQILLFPLFLREINYSFFSASAGFTFDTDTICQMTEPMAMTNERTAAAAKIHQ